MRKLFLPHVGLRSRAFCKFFGTGVGSSVLSLWTSLYPLTHLTEILSRDAREFTATFANAPWRSAGRPRRHRLNLSVQCSRLFCIMREAQTAKSTLSMKAEDLKPNKILLGPIFPEPVQIIVCIPMGDAV